MTEPTPQMVEIVIIGKLRVDSGLLDETNPDEMEYVLSLVSEGLDNADFEGYLENDDDDEDADEEELSLVFIVDDVKLANSANDDEDADDEVATF